MTDKEKAIVMAHTGICMLAGDKFQIFHKSEKYIKCEVLDKIRAEMHATAEKHEDGVYYLRDEWIDEIIDKYKAESEGKE